MNLAGIFKCFLRVTCEILFTERWFTKVLSLKVSKHYLLKNPKGRTLHMMFSWKKRNIIATCYQNQMDSFNFIVSFCCSISKNLYSRRKSGSFQSHLLLFQQIYQYKLALVDLHPLHTASSLCLPTSKWSYYDPGNNSNKLKCYSSVKNRILSFLILRIKYATRLYNAQTILN